jgi:DNA-binding Xre family transcriptional regulator
MEIHNAFDRTLKDFGIRASVISASSGIAESDISKFRSGNQDIRGSKIEKLLNALPVSARDYFWLLFKSGDDVPKLSLSEKGSPYNSKEPSVA